MNCFCVNKSVKLHLEASIGANMLTVCRHEQKEWRDAGISTCQETIFTSLKTLQKSQFGWMAWEKAPRKGLDPNSDQLKTFGPSHGLSLLLASHMNDEDAVTGPASLVNGARRYEHKCLELRTNNWRAPQFCFCETYRHERSSLDALTRDRLYWFGL